MSESECRDAPVRVLVVASERESFGCIRRHLEDEGSSVAEALDGPVALAEIERSRPDVVLLGVGVSGMAGLEVLADLRQEWPDLPIIVVSDQGTMDDVIQAVRLGAWDYVVRSSQDMEPLDRSIAAALRRASRHRQAEQQRRDLAVAAARRSRELANASVALERKAVALREIVASVDEIKEGIGRQVLANVEHNVLPLIESLRRGLSAREQALLDQIEAALGEVTSPFARTLSREFSALTSTELRICSYISRGLGNKEIARMESISAGTVNVHRNNIRRKLGLIGTGTNLVTHLQARGDGAGLARAGASRGAEQSLALTRSL